MKLTCKTNIGLLLLIALNSGVMAQNVEHSPRLQGTLDYEIGGGYIADAPTPVNTVPILEMGVGWDMNMECGRFEPKISVSNQLNGVTDGFKNMMDNIIQSATGAVASLPALALQRANPGLYDMLQQGILQGKMDFEWAETTCEDMSNVLMGDDSFPYEKYKLSIKSNHWAQEINQSEGDAIAAKQALDEVNHGNAGIEWACGLTRGGTGQAPIRALSDVVEVGYNILFDRVDSCATATLSDSEAEGATLWHYWNGPLAASQWATSVLGDMEMRTCDGCKKLRATPGKGLTYQHREMTEAITGDLQNLVSGATQLTWQHLNQVSAPPGVLVNDAIIMAIRKKNAPTKGAMIRKLSSEIAYTRLIEQGRLLTQLLRTGIKEPNIAAFEPAKLVVHEAIDQLQVELAQLDLEITTRQAVAQHTLQRILGQEEKAVQNVHPPRRGKASGTNQVGQPN